MPAIARALAFRVPADHAGPRPNSDPIDGFPPHGGQIKHEQIDCS
jgi:hypothetical protein